MLIWVINKAKLATDIAARNWTKRLYTTLQQHVDRLERISPK